jgi:hypothetical protein
MEPVACDHRWKLVKDWYGDPNVYRGTQRCDFMRCSKCEAEAPLDWDELYEQDPPERERE